MTRCSLALALGLGLLACNTHDVSEVAIDSSHEERVRFPIDANGQLDLLFVIDNSFSMAAEQSSLIADFDTMLAPLAELPGELPSLHVGVISTDVGTGDFHADPNCVDDGDGGALQVGAGCGPDGTFLIDVKDPDGGRTRNYTGELGASFACMAELGTAGCGYEQPLESIRRALDPDAGVNPGFLRDDALLAIVILSDEDDCSAFDDELFTRDSFRCFEHGVICDGDDPRALGAHENCVPRDDSEYLTPIDELVGFVKGLKAYEQQLVVAGIVGRDGPVVVEPDPRGDPFLWLADSCPAPTGAPDDGAKPPIRLAAFLDRFTQHVQTSICDADLSAAMAQIGDYLVDRLQYRCLLGRPADIDPTTDGVQPDCVVSEVERPGTDDEVETLLPPCIDDGPGADPPLPCYRIVEDLVACGDTPSRLSIEVEYGDAVRPPGTIIDARCLID